MRDEHFLHYYDSNYQRSESVRLFLPSLHLSNLLLILASLFLSSLPSSLLMLSLPLSPDPIMSLFTIFLFYPQYQVPTFPPSPLKVKIWSVHSVVAEVLSPLCIYSPRWPSIICWGDNTTSFTLTLCIIILWTAFAKWLRLKLMPPAHRKLAPFLSLSVSILPFKCHCCWTKSGVMCLERHLMLYFGKFLSKCLWQAICPW